VVLHDAAGNDSTTKTDTTPASPAIDATRPVISSVTLTPNSGTLKIGDPITVNITAGEAGLAVTSVKVNNEEQTVFNDLGGGSYTALCHVVSGDTDRASGAVPVHVVLHDAAGNDTITKTDTTPASPAIDATRPAWAATSISLSADNTTATIYFDSAVYGNSNGTGKINSANISITDSAGDSATITGINQQNAGDTQADVSISGWSPGTPATHDTFTVNVTDDTSIYDAAGNAMLHTGTAGSGSRALLAAGAQQKPASAKNNTSLIGRIGDLVSTLFVPQNPAPSQGSSRQAPSAPAIGGGTFTPSVPDAFKSQLRTPLQGAGTAGFSQSSAGSPKSQAPASQPATLGQPAPTGTQPAPVVAQPTIAPAAQLAAAAESGMAALSPTPDMPAASISTPRTESRTATGWWLLGLGMLVAALSVSAAWFGLRLIRERTGRG
jgi:hypothetical protein